MLKEIHGQCIQQHAEVIKELQSKFPVTIVIIPGLADSQVIFSVFEKEAGVIGPEFFSAMKARIDHFVQLEQSTTQKVQLALPVADQKVSTEKALVIEPAKVSYLLTLWGHITAQLSPPIANIK